MIVWLWEDNGGGLYLESTEYATLARLEYAREGGAGEDMANLPEWAGDWASRGDDGEYSLTEEQWLQIQKHPETKCIADWDQERGLCIREAPGAAGQSYLRLTREQADWAMIGRLLEEYPAGIPIAILRMQIADCPQGATNLNSLCEMIADATHDIDVGLLTETLKLEKWWDWDLIRFEIEEGNLTAQQVDNAIHAGLR